MKFRTLAVALAAAFGTAFAATAAHAATLSIFEPEEVVKTGANHDFLPLGSKLTVGDLRLQFGADQAVRVSYTFTFEEAAYNNAFFHAGKTLAFRNDDALKPVVTDVYTRGTGPKNNLAVLDFGFGSNTANLSSFSKLVFNGHNREHEPNFGIKLDADRQGALLFFNDTGGSRDHDWDDMIVHVRIAPVPEPSTYAMLLGGLGLLGLMARRRTIA